MKIPRYWARDSQSIRSPDGQWYKLEPWRWSDISVEDAAQQAHSRLQELAARVERGEKLNRYSYGERPLREEIIRSVGDGSREVGIITRNAYGSLVLNAESAMFIDIDFSDQEASVNGLWNAIRGKPHPGGALGQQAAVLQSLDQWVSRNPGIGMRVYRTYGGIRALITNAVFDPCRDRSLEILRELKADPLYIKLCREQECFRARLSPKPWRCHSPRPPVRYPFDDSRDEWRYRTWEQEYNLNSARFAVCQLLRELGPSDLHPDIAPIMKAHDEACLSDMPRQLA